MNEKKEDNKPAAQLPAPSDELQLAVTKANSEYNLSVAGQIQRQFEAMQRIGKAYADSTIVPKAYQGNIGNCVIAIEMGHRMNLPPLMVMQNLYVVSGNPTWSSKFLVATINQSGKYTALRYRKRNLGKVGKVDYNATVYDPVKKQNTLVVKQFDGSGVDNIECVAYATEKATGETLESDAVTIEMAVKEGWYTKSGSKWVTMPNLMLSYRAAAFWARTYCPEVAMGFITTEEAEDIVDVDYREINRAQRLDDSRELVNSRKRDMREQMRQSDDKSKAPSADTARQQTLDMP